jgi:hypothetical protein
VENLTLPRVSGGTTTQNYGGYVTPPPDLSHVESPADPFHQGESRLICQVNGPAEKNLQPLLTRRPVAAKNRFPPRRANPSIGNAARRRPRERIRKLCFRVPVRLARTGLSTVSAAPSSKGGGDSVKLDRVADEHRRRDSRKRKTETVKKRVDGDTTVPVGRAEVTFPFLTRSGHPGAVLG